eukprot:gnl/TRDRNA2_/TRDRNA2_170491_c0_seq3.p1 gnl/TRDRNA2_/TRDRNA2_170491_c0~~gnl/TRDRNA2_/TRDRNA2_170491_c0_seq3.p1  ORF type:complete len:284 (-),score=29.83 gnl/TRDRNA2_/TRDRNA2_170491_c0_seq3:27-878(-)
MPHTAFSRGKNLPPGKFASDNAPSSEGGAAAEAQETQTTSIFHKTGFCKFYRFGACNRGQRCAFAHHPDELRPLPDFQRTKICPTLLQTGSCAVSDCGFAHSKDELRPSFAQRRLQELIQEEASRTPAQLQPTRAHQSNISNQQHATFSHPQSDEARRYLAVDGSDLRPSFGLGPTVSDDRLFYKEDMLVGDLLSEEKPLRHDVYAPCYANWYQLEREARSPLRLDPSWDFSKRTVSNNYDAEEAFTTPAEAYEETTLKTCLKGYPLPHSASDNKIPSVYNES